MDHAMNATVIHVQLKSMCIDVYSHTQHTLLRPFITRHLVLILLKKTQVSRYWDNY